ncbi:MAG: RnfABCDGE type electron transport complex subunit B [bacterium]
MIAAVLSLGGIAFILALGLGIASKVFTVEIDPKVAAIAELLPGANCGGCGYAGCAGFAEAAAAGRVSPSECKVASAEVVEEMSRILGVAVERKEKKVARILCQGTHEACKVKYRYEGLTDCRAAVLLGGGPKACPYSCLGFGSCMKACPFGALKMGPQGLPVVEERLCTGCGSCVRQCPRGVIQLIPAKQPYYVACSSQSKGKAVREVCQAGCIACGLCVKKCPNQAIQMENNLPVIDPEKCTGCGTCAEKCPQKAIQVQLQVNAESNS